MAIRFKYDATAVAIPGNESRQRFGQQLVLQQQKYANDQRQSMRDQLYDRQRQFTQNAFQLQRAQTDRFVDNQRMKDQQAFSEKMQKNALDAQMQRDQQEAQQRAQMIARQQEMQQAAQLKAQERADDEDAMRTGGYDPVTAAELKKSYALETKIDLNKGLDEAMKAQAHEENRARRSKLQEARIPTPSMAEQANRNLSHYVPSLQQYASPEQLQELKKADPNIEVQVFQDGKMLPGPTPKQGPMSAQDYYRADGSMFKKDLANKMSELQGKVDAGEMTLEKGQDLRSLAWQQMQDDYNFAQQALGTNQPMQGSPAMPQQAVQSSPAPEAQQPVLGMQNLEPTYNADGTTAAPGQPAMQAPAGEPAMRPPVLGNPDATALPEAVTPPPMRVVHQDGRIFERSPDGWKEVKDVASQPIQQADGSMWQQSPVDGSWRAVPPTIQPFRPEQQVLPSRPLQPGEEDGAATFAPGAPGGQQQPAETLPIDQTGMQPPVQNVWAEVAMPEQQKAKMADVADTVKKPVVAPDFAKLSKNAGFKADREVLSKMKEAYENAKTPEIQNAISVLVTPGVPAYEKALAARALRAAGVDLDKLIPSASVDANIDFSSAGVM